MRKKKLKMSFSVLIKNFFLINILEFFIVNRGERFIFLILDNYVQKKFLGK